jgi:formate--tetrahydrofolate ligase
VPALIHGGPFANIAHGTSSIIANKIGLKLADYVVTEAGFGADLGAEKFFDIVARTSDIWPSAVVLVATVKALKYHGGVTVEEAKESGKHIKELRKGLENLAVHVKNMKKFKTPVVVGINKFVGDTAEEIKIIKDFCDKLGVACEAHNGFEKGGDGVTDLANEIVKQAELNKEPEKVMLYDTQQPIEEKIETIAKEIYNADGVYFEKKALKNLAHFKKLGYGKLPVCIAKTQSSISDNPLLKGAPKGFTLTVTDIQLSAGAGFLVIICGNMMLMPGLPKIPAAVNMTVNDEGVISGLF